MKVCFVVNFEMMKAVYLIISFVYLLMEIITSQAGHWQIVVIVPLGAIYNKDGSDIFGQIRGN
jgi:hypothetical protein